MDEGKSEGFIEFEVGGEAVEVEDEGFEVEWGIEAEGRLWKMEGPRRVSGKALHAGMLMRSAM